MKPAVDIRCGVTHTFVRNVCVGTIMSEIYVRNCPKCASNVCNVCNFKVIKRFYSPLSLFHLNYFYNCFPYILISDRPRPNY